jgi:hypothetical protein
VELVYAEIMGVIKGSISSADTFSPLSRSRYLSTSCRLAPTFSAEPERDRVYTIFEQYERVKHQRGEIDYVDRVIALLKSVNESPSFCSQIRHAFDEVYVDGRMATERSEKVPCRANRSVQKSKTCDALTYFYS